MKCSLIKKNKKWYITYNEKQNDGTYKKRWIATGETRKPVAEKKLTNFQYQINNGNFVKPDKITVKDLLISWIKNHVEINLAETTCDNYKATIDNYLIPKLGEVKLQELTPIVLQDYYRHLLKNGRIDGKGGLSPNTVRKHHSYIRKALDYAVKRQLVIRNVADAVELPKKVKFETTVYNEDQVITLLEEVKNTRLNVVIQIAAELGLRRSEICGLRWKDIDFKMKKIHIKKARVHKNKGWILKDTKNTSSYRTLSISENLVRTLKEERKAQLKLKMQFGDSYHESDFVFRNDNGYVIDPSVLSHMFSDLLIKLNLPHIRLHDLRHTNATILLKNKAHYKVVQQRLGHSNINTLFDTYGHVLQEMDEEATNTLSNAIYKTGAK